MSKKNTENNELSMDELKDLSGGIRAQGGGYKKINNDWDCTCVPNKTENKIRNEEDKLIGNPYSSPID